VGPQQQANKLDVLFVVDNSVGMAQKQAILASSVPSFVSTLAKTSSDIHLGVITTSLGNHGGTICTPSVDAPELDDQAQLLPSKRSGLTSYMNSGFLAYDSTGKAGETDAAQVGGELSTMITAAGENGCGFEAPLEAMYRFLIDPEPPIAIVNSQNTSMSTGVNSTLLAQRSAFLRPDSAVAIVILTDENDCSISDLGLGWFVAQASARMPRATSACDTDPNSACCRSCAQNEAAPPAGCSSLAFDANCEGAPAGSFATWDQAHDSLNLRCFDQKQRFGFDLLYPINRYAVGLTNPMLTNRAGALVPNPLLTGRSASLISLSVIVGVPWQDLATADSLSATALSFMSGADLATKQRWPVVIGDPENYTPPSDPFMIESIAPRSGMNSIANASIAPATSQNPQANPINGHEQNIPDNDDLQYACIFQLATPSVCANGDVECSCSASNSGDASAVTAANSPTCQPPGGGAASTTQYYAKSYPGIRELTLAQMLGDRAAPASVCPKTLGATTDPNFGYEPALASLASRVAATLKSP
jgi:hypothetical protein